MSAGEFYYKLEDQMMKCRAARFAVRTVAELISQIEDLRKCSALDGPAFKKVYYDSLGVQSRLLKEESRLDKLLSELVRSFHSQPGIYSSGNAARLGRYGCGYEDFVFVAKLRRRA